MGFNACAVFGLSFNFKVNLFLEMFTAYKYFLLFNLRPLTIIFALSLLRIFQLPTGRFLNTLANSLICSS